jgi:phosphatidylglycerol lysyltransferase
VARRARFRRALGPLLGLGAFVLVLFALHDVLKSYRYRDVVASLRAIPGERVFWALVLTFLSYLFLTAYDALAVRYLHRRMAYRRISLASFIANAFGHNVGFSVLSGGSVRYRMYSAWGLSAGEVATVVAFGSATVWLGFFTLAGLAFVLERFAIPTSLHVPFVSVYALGVAMLLVVAAYLVWSARASKPISLGAWELAVPPPGLSLAQIALSALDWAFAGAALYALLPDQVGLSLPGFIGIYLLAQIVGLASQVPGGLGVFETVLLLLLTPHASTLSLLGPLLAYRAIYYLIPLGVAAVLMGSYELVRRREGVKQVTRIFGRWVPGLVPHVLAFTTFVGGAILLVSGATPGVRGRLTLLHGFLPLPVIEISHFLGSVAGMGLLVLARGIQRRIDVAYVLTVSLLGAGIVFSLLKGFDYEEALALAVMLAALLPSRRHFYRRASLLSGWFTPGWLLGIAVVLIGSVWLGFFAYRHVEYSAELWWRFALHGDAPRFLRASVGAAAVALVVALARLLRPVAPEPTGVTEAEETAVREIVAACPHSSAWLALLGDKLFLLNEARTAFLMYRTEGRSWVAVGNAVGGDAAARRELVWRFRELADRHGGWPAFYEVGREDLPLYLELGLSLLKVGEEGRVPLPDFSLEGHTRKWLRHVHRRLGNEGCTFELLAAPEAAGLMPELRRISDAWLALKETREKGFSLGFFDEDYLANFPIALVRREGRIVAFANVWIAGAHAELSIDLMRCTAQAPPGVMDYLLTHLMLWGSAEGFQWFNLGMAPLSGLQSRSLAPTWDRLGALIFGLGEHYYNFQGLRQFKDKYGPVWEPKYLASPGGLVLPRILANVAALVSGGLKGVIAK